jgi:phosphatidylserine/phosphatidylglycerophosphate/cardiolipin synthase-like enzyme
LTRTYDDLEVMEMELMTLLGACTVGVAVGGFFLHQNKKPSRKDKVEGEFSSVAEDDLKVEYLFTKTEKKPDRKLMELIDKAKHQLDIAMYTFTDQGILQRIIQATNRGVKVRLITDSHQLKSARGQDKVIEQLKNVNIPIKVNSHGGFMHLKITIIDESYVTVGSYNFTKAAKDKHDEVLVVIGNKKIAKEWTQHFNQLWNDNRNYNDLKIMVNKAS